MIESNTINNVWLTWIARKALDNIAKRGVQDFDQPMTMTNDVTMGPKRFEPLTVLTPVGTTIEYRWASKLPGRREVPA